VCDRYYYDEHFRSYARLREEGLATWNDLHGDAGGYDAFQNRDFLARVLPHDGAGRRILEYGCGTGPAACFLAARGYQVDAIDLVPDAIEVARLNAAERGLKITFAVADVCRWQPATARYDYVLDSFCLQSIVTDADRSAVLNGVRNRLEPSGRYLLSTAVYSSDREYDGDHDDRSTGIVWVPTDAEGRDTEVFAGRRYQPNRRHLRFDALVQELAWHGLEVVDHDLSPGVVDLVARLRAAEQRG
jgi:SAM-dependent methyltransferase